jgi:hypothetical protein
MSMQEMDYFNQKPNLDMKAFYEGKGVRQAANVPVQSGAAPPPKDSVWVSQSDQTEE